MELPLRRRRAIVKYVFLLMPLVIVVVTVFAVVDLCKGRPNGRATYTFHAHRQADGTFGVTDASSAPPFIIVSCRVAMTTSPPNGVTACDGVYSAMHWWIDIKSDTTLTQAERRQITVMAFGFSGQTAPAEASTIPSPGTTSVSGDKTTVHYGRAALWLLAGAPGFAMLVWLVTGLALWLTRNRGRRGMLCAHCGYDRAGLPAEAPCPECGKAAGDGGMWA
ncbi:MAG: hypothetical protein QM783_17305 [Phycisphaerales bacterium]